MANGAFGVDTALVAAIEGCGSRRENLTDPVAAIEGTAEIAPEPGGSARVTRRRAW
jgi:hypothetical protein